MEINFGGEFSEANVRQAIKLVSRPTGWRRITRWLMPVGTLLALGLSVYVILTGEEDLSYRMLRSGILFLLLGYYSISPYLKARQLGTQFWRRLQQQGRQRGQADALGVTWQAGERSSQIGWDQFDRRFETPDLLVLLTAEGVLHMFPRQFFASESDWKRFIDLTSTRVKVVKS